MLAIARMWSAVEGLYGYLLALVALAAGYLAESAVEQSSLWVSWNRSLAPGISFVLVNSAKLIPVTTLAVSLIGSGLSRADLRPKPPPADRRFHAADMTGVFNLVAPCPALSVPCGSDAESLPVGLQVVARRWREGTALHIGRAVEVALPNALRRPPFRV